MIQTLQKKLAFILLLGVSCIWPAVSMAAKHRVAIMPMEASSGISQNLREATRLELERQLVKTGKVDVIERDKLKRLSEEMRLSLTGVVDPSSIQELGKIAGVSVFLFPRITSAWSSVKHERIPIVNEDEVTVKAGFALALKLVHTETSRIMASEKASGGYSITRMESEGGYPSKGGALATARSRALGNAGAIILGAIYPIKVAHYNDKTGIVTVNRGKGALKVGVRLKVFAQGEVIIDPDTGEALGSDEEQIGLIKITAVRAKLSKAKIIDGGVELGAICR